jgi:hypothetical protein
MKKPNFSRPIKVFLSSIGILLLSLAFNPEKLSAQCACQSGFIVPLDNECQGTISSSMVFSGGGCPTTNFKIVVFSNSQTPPSKMSEADATAAENAPFAGEGNWMYGVYTLDTDGSYNLFCWNTFKTEDKISPEFCCPDYDADPSNFQQYGGYELVQYNRLTDTLEGSDTSPNQFRPGLWSCWQSTNHSNVNYTWPDNATRNYKVLQIHPAESAVYTFFVGSELNTGTSDPSFDAAVALFGRGGFNPQDPCQNIVAFSQSTFIPNPLGGLGYVDSTSMGLLPGTFVDTSNVFAPWMLYPYPIVRIDLKLAAGQKYDMVVTSREPNATGRFEVFAMRNLYDTANTGGVLLDTIGGSTLPVVSRYRYFDFLCGDLPKVQLPQSVVLNQNQYRTGGNIFELANSFGITTAEKTDSAIKSELCQYWTDLGELLLSTPGNSNISRNLDYYYNTAETVDLLQYRYGFKPMVFENCGLWNVTVSDTYNSFGDCGFDQGVNGLQGLNISGRITRRYVVRDVASKTSSDECTITMNFRNPSLLDVRLPHYTSFVECDEMSEITLLPNGLPSPVSTGYPFLVTLSGIIDLTPVQAYCNLGASYEDLARVDVCQGSFRFRRQWTVYDWCRPGTTVIYNQIIKVGDWTAPQVFAGSINTAISSFNCNGSARIQRGSAEDLCSSTSNVSIEISVKNSQGNTIAYFPNGTSHVDVTNLPVGSYQAIWTATDQCGNKDTVSRSFIIEDVVAPSCVIDDVRNVSLTNYSNSTSSGSAWLEASKIDQGSRDNCSEIEVEVRRMLGRLIDAPTASWLEYLQMNATQAQAAGLLVQGIGDTFFTDWRQEIPFYCVDVKEGLQDVKVEMRVREKRTGGLQSICWMYVNVEDKNTPSCYNLNTINYIYNCDDVPAGNLSAPAVWDSFFTDITLANVAATTVCGSVVTIVGTTNTINSCGVGEVTRSYRVTNVGNGLQSQVCQKTISFIAKHDYSITFPADTSVTCNQEPNAATVQWVERSCDLITLSNLPVERYQATADECYKEFKTYRLINWCEYDGDGGPTVISRDENNNQILGEKVTINVKYSATSDSAAFAYWTSVNPSTSASSNFLKRYDLFGYNNFEPGFFQYTQVIKVYDNQQPDITILNGSSNRFPSYSNVRGTGLAYCPGAVRIQAQLSDDCTSDTSQVTIVDVLLDVNNDGLGAIVRSDKNFDFSHTSTNVYTVFRQGSIVTFDSESMPIGNHSVRFVARDGCGNVRVRDYSFTVFDAKAPTPLCINGLAIELMPIGPNNNLEMSIRATDFITGTEVEDCHPQYTYYIKRREDGSTLLTNPDSVLSTTNLNPTVTYRCEDLRIGTGSTFVTDSLYNVYIIMEDGVGNRDYCLTTVRVQNNLNACGGPLLGGVNAQISGLVSTEDDDMVKDVEVVMSGSQSGMVMSSPNGSFTFQNLKVGDDYSITPKKSGMAANGVTTFDMVLISRHILNVTTLDSPYKIIAADVNNSKSVTTLDLIQIRKIILSIDSEFANNKNWRFIPANYKFSNPKNPWADAFPEILNINNLSGNMANADFVAIKTGDVNNSANVDVQPRSGDIFELLIDDQELVRDQVYTIMFKADSKEVLGYQFALQFEADKLEWLEIVEAEANKENFGTRYIDEGILLTSWNGDAHTNELFGLVFRAKSEGKLSDLLRVSSRYLTAEAYNNKGEAMGVSLHFISNLVEDDQFALYQNAPNPVKGNTQIRFNLPSDVPIEFSISDVTGRVLKVIRANYQKGVHVLQLDSKDLPKGVLYYQLKAGSEFVETKSMIVID